MTTTERQERVKAQQRDRRLANALQNVSDRHKALLITKRALTQEIVSAERRVKELLVEEHGFEAFRDRPKTLALGGWECENSPTGHCIYDNQTDWHHDDCLVCHDPSERK